jgi:hypothetical protein
MAIEALTMAALQKAALQKAAETALQDGAIKRLEMTQLHASETSRIGEVNTPEIKNKAELHAEEQSATRDLAQKFDAVEKYAWENRLTNPETRSYSVENGSDLLNGDLPKNANIELTSDTRIKTDEKGRVAELSSDQLKLVDGVRDMEQQRRCVGLKDGVPTDDAGHLQARGLGGSSEQVNLLPMDSWVNRHGEYRNMERSIEKALQNGATVTDYKVNPQYEGDSKRPVSFEVSYKVDGMDENRFIDNTPRGN